ncbi:hypothetical protein BCV70DRAFT_175384 [Testicularia cyperi]|uniref:FAD-binding PCMH-type domain-containing protein n=1 Tax=Testicularia cyperi TaxID=1882483 RepID=A0A317XRL5_9BASI|nr:hypothetical protein BCV70DRAFT_175384 [Testicularia cyperi]
MTTRIPQYDLPEATPLDKEQLRERHAHYEALRRELAEHFAGPIALRGETVFARSVAIFNDAAPLGAWMVTMPASAAEISAIVKFCNAHNISPSVKSGGYATAGWAIQGEVVIDTGKMDDVQLIMPKRPARASGPFVTASAINGEHSSPLTVPHATLPISVSTDIDSARPAPEMTAQSEQDAVVIKTESIGAVDQAVKRHMESSAAPATQDSVTRKDMLSSDSSQDVDPQDTASFKSKARKADQAFGITGEPDSGLPDADGESASVRRRTEVPSDAEQPIKSRVIKAQAMQQGRSNESGADADSESSYASSDHEDAKQNGNESEGPGRSMRPASSRGEYMSESEPRDVGTSRAGTINGGRRPSRVWVDRKLDQLGNGSASPSGSNSGSGGGGGGTTNSTSSLTPGSKLSSAQSSSIGGEHSDRKLDGPGGGDNSTDGVTDETFRLPSSSVSGMFNDRPHTRTSRTASGSGSGSGSDAAMRHRRSGSNSQTPDDWDPNSSSEHTRWQRHHRPPSNTPGERLILPEGGFVWRSDGADAGISSLSALPGSLPWDSTAFAASPDGGRPGSGHSSGEGSSSERESARLPGNGQFAASTLSDLQDAWPSATWAVNTDAVNDPASNLPRFIPSPLQTYPSPPPLLTFGADKSIANPSTSHPYSFEPRTDGYHNLTSSILPPGMYEDRYALASFGPGAGIRGLDAFTDKAGRDGNFLADLNDRSKGKGRAMEDEQVESPLIVNGVPYHVPVSAYPVGSTAMTTGGFGYLTRAYGLSLDNIVEVEMVLADGRIVTLNKESKNKSPEEQDLWWAVRGAAPCFGIVSRLTAKAYPVPSVYSGNLIYPLNPATAGSLIRHWRDCLKAGLPRSFYTNLILTAGPSKTSHVIVIQVCFLGPKNEGETLVQAISSWTGERLLLKDVEERSFLAQQDGVAKVLKGGVGRRWMVRGDLISTLTDDVIAQSVRKFQGLGSRAVWLFELMGGAVEDSPADETCIGREAREAKFTVGSLQQWSGQAEDRTCIESVERWLNEVVGRVSVGGPYPCFLGRSERMDRVIGAYGLDNFRRLIEIKKRVDPKNMFRHTFGGGFGVDNIDQVMQQLEERETQRKERQQEAAASASNGQMNLSPE